MSTHERPAALVFRRSTYTGTSGNCVEVADAPEAHAVRDSKTPGQPPLFFARDEWTNFIRSARSGDL